MLGLLQREAKDFLQGSMQIEGLSEADIQAQIEARNAAKVAKNYAESDRIRKALLADGIILEDTAAGTGWRRA